MRVWAEFFREHKPRRINITLYDGSDEVYQNLCHYLGGYEKALNGIRLLHEYGVDVKINGSLVKANAQDRMKIIEAGEALDVPVRIDTYMCPATRERNHSFAHQARLNPEDAAIARVEILRREMGEEVFRQYVEQTLYKAENTPVGEAKQEGLTCQAGKSHFIVSWQGMMRPCIVADEPSVNVFECGFDEAWRHIIEESQKIKKSIKCSQCKLRYVCDTCAVSAYLETGQYDGVPEYLCRYTKKIIEILQEMQDEMENKHEKNM